MATSILSAPLHGAHRPVFALLTANTVSLVGNVLAAMAIPWFVLETTGSAARTGLVGFFTLLPTVIGAFFGGALVDRLGQKRVSVAADVLSGLSVALIPLLHQTVGLAFWHLLVLVFVGALLDAPGGTARTVLFPEMVERAGMRQERANSAYQGVQRLSQFLGPAAGGVLIASHGATSVLWFNAASFAISALLVAMTIPTLPAKHDTNGRYVDDLREALGFIRAHRMICILVVTISITNLLDSAMAAVVMPVYVKETYGGAEALGFVFAAFGGGAVAGTILFGAIGHRLPRRATYVVCFIGCGLSLWAMAFAPPLAALVAVKAVAGILCGPLNPILMTLFQERVPLELRGRVLGACTASVLVGAPLGVLTVGYLIETVGLQPIVIAIAAAYLVTTVSMALSPALREMDRRQ
jgi:MFS family permease